MGVSEYRNISEWMLLKREMGNGEWEIDCFIFELFCAKIREKSSVLRDRMGFRDVVPPSTGTFPNGCY